MITLREKVNLIKSGRLKAMDNLIQFFRKIDQENKGLNIFLSFNENSLKQAEELDKKISEGEDVGRLAGICVAIKSNICVKDLEVNCASETLKGWISPYDATVIKKLRKEDAIIIGMVNMDEFACGNTGESSTFGPTKNPLNSEVIPGGSSSGSAAAVAAGFCDFSLGSDSGGGIRNPASYCNLVGFKPSYGAVSRYGLIDVCGSLDQIGPLTKNVEDAEYVFNIIRGSDQFDTTTKEISERKLDTKNVRLGIVDTKGFATKEVRDILDNKLKLIASKNPSWKISTIKFPLDIVLETYYLLSYIELFSATRKFDGRRFGKRIDDNCGREVLRRILGGKEVTRAEYDGKYYRNAIKAKKFIKKEFDKLFDNVDMIILPTVPEISYKTGENISVNEKYARDIFTVPASIAGLPAMSIPLEKVDKKTLGIQLIAPSFCENWIFEVARKIELD